MGGRATAALRRVPTLAWVILACALAVRLGAIALVDFTPVSDPLDYQRHAVSIASGGGFPDSDYAPGGGPTALRPPFYPYLLGGAYAVFGTDVLVGQLVGVLCGLVVVALIGLLGARIWGRTEGLIAMAIASVYPPLVLINVSLLSEAPGLALMLASLLAMAAARAQPTRGNIAWCGGLIALAILVRPAFGVLVVSAALALWGAGGARRVRVGRLAGALVVCGLVLVPWTIRNAVVMDGFVPVSTQAGYLLAGTYNDVSANDKVAPAANRPVNLVPEYRRLFEETRIGELEMSRRLQDGGRSYIKEHPSQIPTAVWWNSRRMFELHVGDYGARSYSYMGVGETAAHGATAGFYLLAVLALLGVAFGAITRSMWWFWVTPALLWVTSVAISSDVRYRDPLEPFLVLLAAFVVAKLATKLRARSATTPLGPGA